MNIYNYLKKDHRNVADLMEQVVASKTSAQRKQLFHEIKYELTLHADTEEMTFYKTVEHMARTKSTEEKIDHAHDEHDDIRHYLEVLTNLPVESDMWLVTFGEFKYAVTHHVEEEETELFERAKKYLTEEQEQSLAREMDRLKHDAGARISAA